MNFQISISGFVALYIFMLAGFGGWVIIGRVPAILHTPLMSGSNFVHGIVVVGGVYALLNASTVQDQRPSSQARPPSQGRQYQVRPREEALGTPPC
jgi:NAD/NADP transhydrogenase alpha subunit